jgi:hypothetical protein
MTSSISATLKDCILSYLTRSQAYARLRRSGYRLKRNELRQGYGVEFPETLSATRIE